MATTVMSNPWTGGPTSKFHRRHYKKDSRFVLDLYTLTYDSHESLDSIGDITEVCFTTVYRNIYIHIYFFFSLLNII